MEMTGQQRIAAPPQRVWEALLDPAILKECIPGCQSLEKDGDRMRATVAIKIGPISAKFAGAISLTEQDPPRSCRIVGEGQGGNAGFAKGEAKVKLDGQDGATVLTYTVDAQISGRLAQVGGALIDATAKRLAGSFFKRFGELVEVPSGPAPAAAAIHAAPAGTAARTIPPAPASVSDALAPKNATSPAVLLVAIALAAIIGFLIGRGQGGGSEWMGIEIGLLLVLVVGAGFSAGKGSAAPVVILDAAEVARLLRERSQ